MTRSRIGTTAFICLALCVSFGIWDFYNGRPWYQMPLVFIVLSPVLYWQVGSWHEKVSAKFLSTPSFWISLIVLIGLSLLLYLLTQ